jgi:RNA polymerase sigma-70 factor (ECF subfamily)
MAASTPTRASVLERLHDGSDPMAWNDFFERYGPLVFSIARRRGCSGYTAEEIVQDVMLAVFERKAVFRHDPSRGRFRDWLGGVVRRKVALRRRAPDDRCRGRGGDSGEWPEPAASGDGAGSAWEAAFKQAMLAFLLDVVRREMSPRTYQAFEVLALGQCSGAEAARITGLTRNAVYQARQRVLRRLRQLGAASDRGPPDEAIRAALGWRGEASAERSPPPRIEPAGLPAPGGSPAEQNASA